MNETAIQTTGNGTLLDFFKGDEFKAAIGQVLPKYLTADRMARCLITATMRAPDLLKCTKASILDSMMTLSQLGLEPDGRRAHLIPFNTFNKKKNCKEWLCQLIIDYKGFVALITRTGATSKIHADIICENDLFEYDMGEVTKHQIDWSRPRGKAYAVWAMVEFKDGAKKFDVMTMEDVEKIRQGAVSKNSPAWCNHYNEMAKKTVFRRLAKWISWDAAPDTVAVERYNQAIDIDNDQFAEMCTVCESDDDELSTPEKVKAQLKDAQ